MFFTGVGWPQGRRLPGQMTQMRQHLQKKDFLSSLSFSISIF